MVKRVNEVIETVEWTNREVTCTWVPSHCGIVGNELADQAVNEASREEQREVEVSFKGMKSVYNKRMRREVWRNDRCRRVYGVKGVNWEKEKGWSREECVMMARLRSGHSLELGGYKMKLDKDEDVA